MLQNECAQEKANLPETQEVSPVVEIEDLKKIVGGATLPSPIDIIKVGPGLQIPGPLIPPGGGAYSTVMCPW
jgi:hypothetical protein